MSLKKFNLFNKAYRDDSFSRANSSEYNVVYPEKRKSSSLFNTIQSKKIKKKTNQIYINNYQIIKVIGEGSFSEVKLCIDTKTGIQYAIKQMNKKFLRRKILSDGKNAYESVLEEMKIL